MENIEPNLKPQPTGGLKLMTVFIAVLALHVLVIGGFTVWHLLYPANVDNDLAADKTHKGAKVVSDSSLGDVATTDTASADKAASIAPADNTDTQANNDAATAAPAPATKPAVPAIAANKPAPAPASTEPPMTVTPPQMEADASSIASNPPSAPAPSGPVHQGPVVTPPANLAPPADNSIAADASAPVTEGTPYTVKRGDSLARIAHRHHVSILKLRTANSLASDALHIGQKLTIPNRAQKTATATADTLATEAASTPETRSAPASTAPVAQPVTESDIAASGGTIPNRRSFASSAKHTHHAAVAASRHSYTVVKGDTLTKIAKRYHTTSSAIAAANSMADAGRLSIGQKLHIPGREARASATAQQVAPLNADPQTMPKGQLANYVQ